MRPRGTGCVNRRKPIFDNQRAPHPPANSRPPTPRTPYAEALSPTSERPAADGENPDGKRPPLNKR